MKIEDKRVRSTWVPAVRLLENIVPHIPQDYLVGIRKLVLLDDDYHASKSHARGRYVQVQGANTADVEMYLGTFDEIPESLRDNEIFLTYQLAVILTHELFHHSVRGLHKSRRPSRKTEETKAKKWSLKKSEEILHTLFPPDQFKAEYERITGIHKKEILARPHSL